MRLQFTIPQKILTWICFALIALCSSSSADSRITEEAFKCTSSAENSSVHSNPTAIMPNFFDVMETILADVNTKEWGVNYVIFPQPPVFAMAQCHSDLSQADCNLCYSQGKAQLQHCLPGNAGRVFLDGCFLRYDNYKFFNESVDRRYDSVNCTKRTVGGRSNSVDLKFKNKVAEVIQKLIVTTLANGTFATIKDVGLVDEGGVLPVYSLAQCWYTLNNEECKTCLEAAGPRLLGCAPGEGGSALFTGCYMRYSSHRFFWDETDSSSKGSSHVIIILAIVLLAIALAFFCAYIEYKRLSMEKEGTLNLLQPWSNLNFKYEVLEKATDYFSDLMKLGQGGAGSVYKGVLPDGKVVAVKRLVYNTRQWVDQFFNEVNLINGIQHKNLVQLLGCSIEGPESLLVFEHVPNGSLDQILFGKNAANSLSWTQRLNIIIGVAEGLAYLHGGSGVKIIHRDIKASNVLLDENLTAKIGDFGLARGAAGDNTNITSGIAGTLGYMAPEYLVRGQLTEKADVYAFGVVVIEIASGKKNSVFSQGSSSILHSVWKHYKANSLTNTIDPVLKDDFPEEEAAKVLQIGLLCTQASAALRPSMTEVVRMLTDNKCEVPFPKQPPFLNASVLSPNDSTDSFSFSRASLTQNSSTRLQIAVISKQTSSNAMEHSHTSGNSSTSPKDSSHTGPS